MAAAIGNVARKKFGLAVVGMYLLAQMADRLYLEKLFLLFKEFQEAALPGFDSELELLQKTEGFYEFVAKKRLEEDFGGIAKSMKSHFRARWDIDRDLYEESISNNIVYLKAVIQACESNYECYGKSLKRGGILERILEM